MPQVFTFSSGYQFWVKEDYNPFLVDLAISTWRSDNPQPEPTTKYKEVPVKGGKESIPFKDWNDPTYIALYSVWLSDLQVFQTNTYIKSACDYDKLDSEVLTAAREFAEKTNMHFFSDDALLFVHVVSSHQKPASNKPSEYETFIDWVKSLGGPSEALIEMFLKKRVPDGDPTPGEDDRPLAMPDVRKSQSGQAKAAKGSPVQSVDLQGGS